MSKRGTTTPWMPAAAYGRSLEGFGVNLLVRDIARALEFQTEVLAAAILYSDVDFAALRFGAAQWMLHADHTYDAHPLGASLGADVARGVGVELRVHGRDPDAAQAAARRLGFHVLQGATDKPHGLREACLLDADGYLWVPDIALPE